MGLLLLIGLLIVGFGVNKTFYLPNRVSVFDNIFYLGNLARDEDEIRQIQTDRDSDVQI